MAKDEPLTVQVSGLEIAAPELSFADSIPPPGILIELPNLLAALPGQVMEIAGDLPDMLACRSSTTTTKWGSE